MAILALDQGTTSSRAVIIDHDGRLLAQHNCEFPQHYPQPGWVSHRPQEILDSQNEAVAAALAKAGLAACDIEAIGLTNQRETTIVWDAKTGEPVADAIVWQCRRTADACAQLSHNGYAPMIHQKTGLPIDAYFSATKLAWLLEHTPDGRQRAADGALLFGTVDSYLLWQYTGGKVHATDATNASRTMLYNLREQDWDDELLSLFDIPRTMLPRIQASGSFFGQHEALDAPILAIAGDQHAALFGQRCFQSGQAKNTYGTGCFLLMHTGQAPIFSESGLITTLAATLAGEPAEYALEGSVFIAGAAIQWLRDELRMIDSAAETSELALSVPDTGGVVLVPAFSGLGAPHWDMFARGSIMGITRGTNRAHIVRAALEAIAMQNDDVLRTMQADTGMDLMALRVDGGASVNDFLMQFQADILDATILCPDEAESTAMGVAYLAGLGAGIWPDRQGLPPQRLQRSYTPQKDSAWRNTQRALWHKAVSRTRHWLDS